MKLTKQEQTAIFGKLINNVLGLELAKDHIDPQKLEKAVVLHNEINDITTPKQTREALINVLDKVIDDLVNSKE